MSYLKHFLYELSASSYYTVDLGSKSGICRAVIHTSDLISLIEGPFFLSDDNFWLPVNIMLFCQRLLHISTEWPVGFFIPNILKLVIYI